MTTSTMARPTTGAGPAPENQETPMADYRTYERILTAIGAGRISRDPHTYEYVDSKNMFRNVDLLIFELEDCGWVRLHMDGRVEVTPDGEAWQARPRRRGPVPAAQFSDQPGQVA